MLRFFRGTEVGFGLLVLKLRKRLELLDLPQTGEATGPMVSFRWLTWCGNFTTVNAVVNHAHWLVLVVVQLRTSFTTFRHIARIFGCGGSATYLDETPGMCVGGGSGNESHSRCCIRF